MSQFCSFFPKKILSNHKVAVSTHVFAMLNDRETFLPFLKKTVSCDLVRFLGKVFLILKLKILRQVLYIYFRQVEDVVNSSMIATFLSTLYISHIIFQTKTKTLTLVN